MCMFDSISYGLVGFMASLSRFIYFNNRSDTEKRILEAACLEYDVAPDRLRLVNHVVSNIPGQHKIAP